MQLPQHQLCGGLSWKTVVDNALHQRDLATLPAFE
jgi:hypothetical protein